MVSSWYLTHATKNVVWIFTLSFFVLQRKTQGSCMSKHENNRYAVCRTKSMLNAYAWWCNDSYKMWGWNMITDKCRNDMFIMMPWRDTYAMHDMNAFTDMRARKIISSYLHIWGDVDLPASRDKGRDQHTMPARDKLREWLDSHWFLE